MVTAEPVGCPSAFASARVFLRKNTQMENQHLPGSLLCRGLREVLSKDCYSKYLVNEIIKFKFVEMNGGTLSRKIGEMMDIQLNELSKKEFDPALINEITPDTGYSIWTKKDPFGRAYFGVGNFCGMDRSINEDTDLSWLEWDGNEVNISNNDKMLLFEKTIGIMKGWINQLVESYPDDSFVVFASFDDGNALVEECERNMSFTLRFWKKREGSGLDENMEYNQPVIRWSN